MSETLSKPLSEPQVTVALETLALHSGGRQAAVERLSSEGIEIEPNDLAQLARDRRRDYRDARIRVAEQVKEGLADLHHLAAVKNLELEHKALKQLDGAVDMEELPPSNLIKLVTSSSGASSTHTEKGQLLSGEPTQRVERTPDEIMRSLEARKVKVKYDYELEAEEIEDPAA